MNFLGKKLVATSALVSAVTVLLVLPAQAQDAAAEQKAKDAKQAEYDAKGVPVGSFRAFPKLDVSVTHDDNIYKEKTGKNSDTITNVKPSLSLRSDWNRHSLRLDAAVDDAYYRSKSADNYTTYDLRLRGKADITKALTAKGNLRRQTGAEARGGDDVSSDAAAPVDTLTHTAGVDVAYKPNRLGVTVGATLKDYDYDDNQTIGGATTNNDDRDRKDTEGYVRVGYDIQDGYEAYAIYTANDRSYEASKLDSATSPLRDSDGYNAKAGLSVELSKLITADVSAGYLSQDYANATLKDVSGWSADANIRWSVTTLTTLRGTVSRSVGETTTSGVSSTLATNYGVGVDHEFMRNLTAKADVKFAHSDYVGDTNNRKDDKTTYSAGLNYKLNRTFFAGAKAAYEKRDSNINTNDYNRTQYTVNVGAQF